MTKAPPKRIQIGTEEYRVVLMDQLDEKYAGLCFYDESKVLLVDLKQSKQEVWRTFFHEVLHGIEEEYKVELGHKRINKLEVALEQVFSQLIQK